MKENNKTYNAVDIARYHSGAMPWDERHALEKAALEDPFLADALEGYAYSKDPAKELDEIRMRLDEKRKEQKMFSIFSLASGAWWKIAAIFILFAGVGYFFYATNSKKQTSLAVKTDSPKKENSTAISPAKGGTAATDGNIAFEKAPLEKNEINRAKLPSPRTKSIQASRPGKTVPGEIRTDKEKTISEEHLADKNKKENSLAMNRDKAIESAISRNDSGEDHFSPSDTTDLIAASPHANDNDSNAIVMNKNNTALNEVVVIGYGTQKKKSITGAVSKQLEGKASGVNVTIPAPYPKEGKEKFDQYIQDNAVPVFDSAGERITANILLSFALNKKGKPADIKVVESSCEACAKEAIRLLEDGPNWIGKRGDSGTVRIKF